jgi:hypothetical protein
MFVHGFDLSAIESKYLKISPLKVTIYYFLPSQSLYICVEMYISVVDNKNLHVLHTVVHTYINVYLFHNS